MRVEESKKIFIDNVRQRREQEGISVSELARRSGLPLAMLEALDRREIPQTMMVSDAFRLAGAFGCELTELFQ